MVVLSEDSLERSRTIYEEAVARFEPTHVLLAFSGGNDSLATYHAARRLNIPVDAVLHCVTGTGIPEVAEYVREFVAREGVPYIEANAGDAYEQYVLRKGFFGRGERAHEYAYHVLKAGPIRKAISKHIRKGRRRVRVLILNGARAEESSRRSRTKLLPWNVDPTAKGNVWVNLIHDWSKDERDEFLGGIPDLYRNPVTVKLCRSGECLCGTMQAPGDRYEAAHYFPEWGEWLDRLERQVLERGFTWRWGENVNDLKAQMDGGQASLFGEAFMPMCVSCKEAA